ISKFLDTSKHSLSKYNFLRKVIFIYFIINIKFIYLFTQFKAFNTNKIFIIPALVNKETNSVSRSYTDKACLLAKTFAEPPKKKINALYIGVAICTHFVNCFLLASLPNSTLEKLHLSTNKNYFCVSFPFFSFFSIFICKKEKWMKKIITKFEELFIESANVKRFEEKRCSCNLCLCIYHCNDDHDCNVLFSYGEKSKKKEESTLCIIAVVFL
ncbi:hypothetical protein RFI_03306, partial [Reticulomyxa filosa]